MVLRSDIYFFACPGRYEDPVPEFGQCEWLGNDPVVTDVVAPLSLDLDVDGLTFMGSTLLGGTDA